VRHDDAPAVRARELDRVERLGQRPDLVDLDEDRIGGSVLDPAAEPLDVRHEEVVADELDAVSEPRRERLPGVPVVLGGAVLDRDDRVALDDPGPELGQITGGFLSPLESVAPVAVDLAHRGIERDLDPVGVTGLVDRLQDPLDRVLARREVGREATFVADGSRQPRFLELLLERVEDLVRDAQALGEGVCSAGNEHELLEVERVVGVRAPVDDVQHRHREHVRVLAADPAVERNARLRCCRLRRSQRGTEDRVRAETALVRRPVERDQRRIDRALLSGVEADQRLCDLGAHVLDGPAHTLAQPGARVGVAQLDGLELTRRGARGDSCAADLARLDLDVDLDRRVPSGVEDLARPYCCDS
jgi:hypothetical protein